VSKEFAVGDRVEFVEDYSGLAKQGDQGVVTYADEADHDGEVFVRVELDNGSRFTVYDWRIKHLEATPVPKEFRFFRRSDSSISEVPYATFEAALSGWKTFAQDGQEVEIIEVVSHGTYKAVLKVEEA